ncbi:leucine rich repeat and phosphatase domain containing protein [Entamoeba nuttalli P19]|uniref:Leucine rich repeat and phosphatase domain containing protein n=1 Tax=Entamoeba nuttalli (strain P19) TaxID=1076696 RepID=K2H7B3_ENTNP|nr:leucine rich repeat and phosphatase domain containing protein [Entamoeba nuttalli P19]EKE42462.1 leucine rich repeat and phosphatase domain containing protein [Entamoeba nuttalli P19]|eukprot:XP_008855209.1 leucine rich repeat and phosphatase domain containing protein [Entamoeba nuttalli P19]
MNQTKLIINKESPKHTSKELESIIILKNHHNNNENELQLKDITFLDLSSQHLKTLPKYLHSLNLIKLDLSNNQIEGDINLSFLSSLQTLDINSNCVNSVKLPSSLETINISQNEINSFEYENNSLRKLSCNNVNMLTVSSPNLIELSCSTTNLIIKQQHLTKLIIMNSLHCEQYNFYQFEYLSSLTLSCCELYFLPQCIEKMNLICLDVSCNLISLFPKNLPTTLTSLNLNYNQISSIPIQYINQLKELFITGNLITLSTVESLSNKLYIPYFKPERLIEIEDGIYVGNKHHSQNKSILDKFNIKSIITVAEILPSYPSFFNYKVIKVPDLPTTNLYIHFNECYNFIESNKNKGSILIHCVAGRSRSGTIAISYFMKKKQLSLDKTLTFIRNKNPKIEPNSGFMEQLRRYEIEINLNKKENKTLLSSSKHNQKCCIN